MAVQSGIRSPTEDLGNHTIVLRQLKEVAEVGRRLRGDPLDSYVQVRELVNAGIVRIVNGQVVAPSPTSLPPTVVPSTRQIKTVGSLTGGGTLAADRTLQLVGDVGAPGNNFYYGTNGAGVKGFYGIPNSVFTKGAQWVASSGAVTVPTNDVVRQVPANCSLQEIIVTGLGGPGSCSIDIWYVPYSGFPATVANSICGGSYPAISSGTKAQILSFGSFTTTTFAQDSFLVFHLQSSSAFTVVQIEMRLQ